MGSSDRRDRSREAFERGAWKEVFDQLTAADREAPLGPAELERLAAAAYLVGRDDESVAFWARGHRESLERDDQVGAARCAFWLGFQLLTDGRRAQGSGWISRGRRLLEDSDVECVERGYLLLPSALGALGEGNAEKARAEFERAGAIGERFGDPDLVALSRLGRGQSRIRSGDVRSGVALLDEAMVAVEAEELSPLVVGVVYCAVLETCQDIFDLRRAREWTRALSNWCESRPELVPFRGQCLVRRSEILRLQGRWSLAMEEARRACDLLSRVSADPQSASAFYERAELHRLRGELDEAERAYREAGRRGREPQPGLALLRMVQGRINAAEAASRRLVESTHDRPGRTRALAAHVEIMLAAGDVAEARVASEELSAIAADLEARWLSRLAGRCRGAVLLAEGDARGALEALRSSRATPDDLEIPLEEARTRILVGLACRDLDAARSLLRRLGAESELLRLGALDRPASSGGSHGLTPREKEVLKLFASGATNRAIGELLFISERTVDRHASNIYTKLDVSSRAAATAYAYEHDLV